MKEINAVKNIQTFKTEIGGKEVTLEFGKLAQLSNGSVLLRCEETVIMANVNMSKKPKDGLDYFPLVVDYEEKMYSVGKIPGGYKKRESGLSDAGILVSRLIDRPIRPLFDDNLRNEVAIVVTPLSICSTVNVEALSMFASSVVLSISEVPFGGPTGSAAITRVGKNFIVNPSCEDREKGDLFVIASGTKDAILMVEADASEATEADILKAIDLAHKEIKKQVAFQEDLMKKIGKPKYQMEAPKEVDKKFVKEVRAFADALLDKAIVSVDKNTREEAVEQVKADALEKFRESEEVKAIPDIIYDFTKEKVRASITEKNIRPDGRTSDQIRPIWCEVGLLPRVHGSGVFTRGQTQCLTAATLGMLSEVQKLDGVDDEDTKRYMHHYNMPPYSLGEARMLRRAGRREIGHGALAEKALEPVLPTEEEFPYAIRLVSEVTSSNGSTSMASTCASTLSLMDAGVPIKAPVAGIAMGLIKEKKKTVILSDIQGVEDFLGDMDFKVTGTEKGITALQMDMKISGIDLKIMKEALEQARVGRMHILGKMFEAIEEPRAEVSKYAPKIITFQINPDYIKDVIGSGGKVINEIIRQTGVKIDIEQTGEVFVAGVDKPMLEKAKDIIMTIAGDLDTNRVYTGEIIKVLPIGAIVCIAPGVEGMIHISKLSKERVAKVEDVVNIGNKVEVNFLKEDDRGRLDFRLIRKL